MYEAGIASDGRAGSFTLTPTEVDIVRGGQWQGYGVCDCDGRACRSDGGVGDGDGVVVVCWRGCEISGGLG
jgi:hypothetical protein